MPSPSVNDDDGFLRVSRVADLLDCSPSYVRDLFDTDRLVGVLLADGERRVFRPFVTGLIAAVRTGQVIRLEDYAKAWKSAQAGRGAA